MSHVPFSCFFFFSSRRRHTRWPRDWSSDVCSSDLRNFASGNASPRQFLERSLELLESWEPRVGAFVCTNLSVARAAADRASERRSEERRVGKECRCWWAAYE